MATPIVLQLQEDALDKGVSVSDLLLNAKLVATKLDLRDAATWIEHELNGYTDAPDIPEYETTGRVWRTFRRADGILAFVAFATGASADDSTREFTATAVQVLDGSASLHYHTGYLITSVTGDLGGAGIPETIRLGDTISVQDRKLTKSCATRRTARMGSCYLGCYLCAYSCLLDFNKPLVLFIDMT
jgi:hypothetical protein